MKSIFAAISSFAFFIAAANGAIPKNLNTNIEIENVKKSLNKEVRRKGEALVRLKTLNKEIENQENLKLELREAIQGSKVKMLRTQKSILNIARDIQNRKDSLRRNISLLVSERDNVAGALGIVMDEDLGGSDGAYESDLKRKVKVQSAGMHRLEEQLLRKIDLEENLEKQQIHAEKLRAELKSRNSILLKKVKVQEKLMKKLKYRTASRVRALRSLKADERDIRMVLNLEMEKAKNEFKEQIQQELSKKWLPAPLKGEIVGRFGKKTHSLLGITMVSKGLKIRPVGSASRPVKAIAKGRVVFAGKFRSYGKMVIVEYYRKERKVPEFYLIGGLKNLLVEKGDLVAMSQKIGEADREIYLEMREGKKAINPLSRIKFI